MTKICIQMEILLVILLRVLHNKDFATGTAYIQMYYLVPIDQIYGQLLTIDRNCKDVLHVFMKRDIFNMQYLILYINHLVSLSELINALPQRMNSEYSLQLISGKKHIQVKFPHKHTKSLRTQQN